MRSQFIQLLDASLADEFDFQPLLDILVARLTAESRFRYDPGGAQAVAADLEIGLPQDDGVRWFAPEADEVKRLVLPKTKLEISYANSEEKEYIWWVAQCLLHGLPFPLTTIDAKAVLHKELLARNLKRPKQLKSIRKRLREKHELDINGVAVKGSSVDNISRKEDARRRRIGTPSELQLTTNKKPPRHQAPVVSQVKTRSMRARDRTVRSQGPSPSPSPHRESAIVVDEGSGKTGKPCAMPSKLEGMDNQKLASKKKSQKQDQNTNLSPGPQKPGQTVPQGVRKKKVKKQSAKTSEGNEKAGNNGTNDLQRETGRERKAPDAGEAAGTTPQEKKKKKKKKVKKGGGTAVESKMALSTHAAAEEQKGGAVAAPKTSSKQESTKNKKGQAAEQRNVETSSTSKKSNEKKKDQAAEQPNVETSSKQSTKKKNKKKSQAAEQPNAKTSSKQSAKKKNKKEKKGQAEQPDVKTSSTSERSNKKESMSKTEIKKEKNTGKRKNNDKQALDQPIAAVPANEGGQSITDSEEALPTTAKTSPTWSGSTTLTTPEVEDLYAAVLRQASEERSMQQQADSQIIAELSAEQNVMPESNQAAASAWTAYRDNDSSSSVSSPAIKAVKTSSSSAYTVRKTGCTVSEASMLFAAEARSMWRGASAPPARAGDYAPGSSEVVLPPTISSDPLHGPETTKSSKQQKRGHEAAFDGPASESTDYSEVRPKKKRGRVVKAMDDRHETTTGSVAKSVKDDNVVYVPNLAEGQKPHFPLLTALMKHASQYNFEGSMLNTPHQVRQPVVKMRGGEAAVERY
ncbi:hypothetical protein LTR20_006028 [Exophiala xenobiotica]|nr:hypothetical protein LTS13_003003 [Exophiala xenobiotica]KAK5395998.1 hypothetical protein LTR79_006752 [Exophiala xenobiotica]KAK5423951.1 hypothetical protein LTR90_001297 [Exophiala xenobiotica]KAK5462079.1 hypothetical protein LTR20_006028 [Exophiala xenobiotica]KAK5479753.1 hypothetical protein LTR26_007606 [Exophiala xenobiotica]